MSKYTVEKIKRIIENENLTIGEIHAAFMCDDTASLICAINEEINDNFDELLYDEEFVKSYHLFFYKIIDKTEKTIDNLTLLMQYLDNTIKDAKSYLKIYTKEGKQKDGFYHLLKSSFIDRLKSTVRTIESYLAASDEVETFKIMWFLITDLKKTDYLFRIIELHPEYINIKNKSGISLFKQLVEYIYANLRFWDNETIKHYKRVFVLMLESDSLEVSNEELFDILELTEKNLAKGTSSVRSYIKFFLTEINFHYEVINKDARVNAQSFVLQECPMEIIVPNMDKRLDLRDQFIVSIDNVKKENIANHLVDDAYSINMLPDGSYELFVHIPDVGEFVSIDSPTDRFMRSLGESVYAHGLKTPLLNYDIATQTSLTHGLDRPAITFIIKVSPTGEVLDIDFKKTIIKVNYNLSRRQAEIFMKNNSDERLFMLNQLYEVSALLRKSRKETIGNRKKSEIIMDEMNIWPDILTAEYCLDQGITFPFKNYFGNRSIRSVEHVSACEEFAKREKLSGESKEVLYSVFDIYNRVYYDTNFVANKSSKNRPIGNVGNPLREYISLETNRMIKDVIISGIKNREYWSERLERDCIEYTETSAKIKQLYRPR